MKYDESSRFYPIAMIKGNHYSRLNYIQNEHQQRLFHFSAIRIHLWFTDQVRELFTSGLVDTFQLDIKSMKVKPLGVQIKYTASCSRNKNFKQQNEELNSRRQNSELKTPRAETCWRITRQWLRAAWSYTQKCHDLATISFPDVMAS